MTTLAGQRSSLTSVTVAQGATPETARRGLRVGLAGFGREIPGRAAGNTQSLLRMAERADALGFDSIWFNEIRFDHDLYFPSPLLLAAAIFARTERLRVGTSVMVLPLHHPLDLAEQIAQLDWQSGGRIDVGIGRGSASPYANAALGVDPETTRDRFVACYEALIGAWTSPSGSSAATPFWSYKDVPLGAKPVQQPHPPIYVAGYTPETIEFAVLRGLPLLLSLEPPEARQLGPWRELVRAHGKPEDLWPSSLTRYVCIGETDEAAQQAVDDLLPRIYQRRVELAARRGTPADQVEARSRESFLAEQAIAGTPEQCIAQIERLVEDPGAGHLRAVFNGNGVLDDETALRGMELFAREVLPVCGTMGPVQSSRFKVQREGAAERGAHVEGERR
jgi:alkanesulfonate monooxygenase SsuD/methylene tetrahydromethanopterin reductase-like flavin-dependent oxidoreductase (luciferase family)